ncbi:hypothetical protein [Actinocorallia longicatena]|uniref:HEAT repeat protein n=1 Tax=Actinocorallia longicatena TaxID=111803 RepID=A0ABP6QHG0_9ACTN
MSDSPAEPQQPAKSTPDGEGGGGGTGGEKDRERAEGAKAKHQELGRRFSARTGQAGSVGERLGAEADALSSFTGNDIKAGAMAGRDIHFHAASAGKDSVRLCELTDLDALGRVFVPPQGFTALVEAVASHRVTVLCADDGAGRYMTARRLLSGFPRVFLLAPETRLGMLTAADLTAGAGYVLTDLAGPAARALTSFELESLVGVLEECDARLVITVTRGRRFGCSEFSALVHEQGPAGDRREMLIRHLEQRSGFEGADRVLDDAEAMALIAEQLEKDVRPVHAATLADLFAEALEGDEPLAAAVRARIELQDQAAFERWADALPDLSTQCMAMAIAVLGGEPYETASASADLLQSYLEPENALESAEQARHAPLVRKRAARLEALRAHVVPSTVQTRHGGTAAGVVRFKDPNLQRRYLFYFWNEYDDARPKLLSWLREYARHELDTVRVRTAVAVGFLTARSFDHVRRHVIVQWARDEDPRLRDAAAVALRGAAEQDPELRKTIRGMVREWAVDEVSPALQATAARAWRLEHDASGSAAALEALEDLSASDEEEVTAAVCETVTEMWEVEGERLDAAALLLGWLGKKDQRNTARLAFLYAAADLVRELPKLDGEITTWPLLLHIATVAPIRQRGIAALWADSLNAAGLHRSAKEVLAEWAHTAEPEPVVRRALARLLAVAAARDGRTWDVIAYEARSWAEGARGAPKCSAEVLRILTAERQFR